MLLPTTSPRGWKPASLMSRNSLTERSDVKRASLPCSSLSRRSASFGRPSSSVEAGGGGGAVGGSWVIGSPSGSAERRLTSGDQGAERGAGLGTALCPSLEHAEERAQPRLEVEFLGAHGDPAHSVRVAGKDSAAAELGLQDVLAGSHRDLLDGVVLLEQAALASERDDARHRVVQPRRQDLKEDPDVAGVQPQRGGEGVEILLLRRDVGHDQPQYREVPTALPRLRWSANAGRPSPRRSPGRPVRQRRSARRSTPRR